MISTFHGIEVGKKGIMANNVGLDTIGHNLANIETEGFSRQKVNLKSYMPIYDPSANRVQTAGQIGTGVEVEDIRRVRDQAIDDRINFEKGGLGYWETKKQFLHQIEMILNDPAGPNVRTTLDAYWEAWQKVAQDPTERAAREELVQRTMALTDTVNHSFRSLYNLRQNADALVNQRVNDINNMAEEIASLNIQIVKSEAVGDNPNDLYDRRDMLVDKLAKMVDVKVERNNKHEVIIFIGSENLVQGGLVNKLQAIGNTDNDGFIDVRWKDGRKVALGAGELSGLVSARDVDLKQAIQNLDSLAVNITDSTNEVHQDGFGLDNKTDRKFFKENPLTPYKNGDYDFNNDGIPDGTALFKMSGTETLSVDTVIGANGFLNFGANVPNGSDVIVQYTASDTIGKVIERINQSEAGVVATLNHKGQLSFKAKYPSDERFPAFVIRHVEDSGNLLTGVAGMLNQSGANGAYDYKTAGAITKLNVPAENLTISPKKYPSAFMQLDDYIVANPDSIAAASGVDTKGDNNPDRIIGFGDGRNALAIADLRYQKIMVERQSTAGDFFKAMIGDYGTRSETAQVNMGKNQAVVNNLINLREKTSGVNVDEELTKMLMFQHGYNASARLVSTMDRMLETLLRMGA